MLLLTIVTLLVMPSMVLADGGMPAPTEPGFDLLFTSNHKEYTDTPITFSNPTPAWLKGTFIRDGPALFEVHQDQLQHDFDGFAKLASWKFNGSDTALFSTKFIRSKVYQKSVRWKKVCPAINVLPLQRKWNTFEKIKARIIGVDNLIVNVLDFTDEKSKVVEFAAIGNTWPMYKFNPNTLDTEGLVTPRIIAEPWFKPFPKFARQAASAHPLPEPGTTNKISVILSARMFHLGKDTIRVVRMTSLGKSQLIGKFELDSLPFVHSFSVTKTKVIIMGSPLSVDSSCSIANVTICTNYDTSATTIPVYIMDLRTGKTDIINIPTVFSIHHINAYDDGNKIIMDVCAYNSPLGLARLQLKYARDPNLRNRFDPRAIMKRITFETKALTGSVQNVVQSSSPLDIATQMDYPVINEAYRSTKYCFTYGLTQKYDGLFWSSMAIVKKDLCNGNDKMFALQGFYPSEPWFVARPLAVDEDDGILLFPVLDGSSKKTAIYILDAKDFSLISTGYSPTFIPYTQHGRFFPEAQC